MRATVAYDLVASRLAEECLALPPAKFEFPDGTVLPGTFKLVGVEEVEPSEARVFLEWVGLIEPVTEVSWQFEFVPEEPKAAP